MPTKRRRVARNQRFRVTPEVIEAYQSDGAMAARRLLGLRPWEFGGGPLFCPEDDEFADLYLELMSRGIPAEREEDDGDE